MCHFDNTKGKVFTVYYIIIIIIIIIIILRAMQCSDLSTNWCFYVFY